VSDNADFFLKCEKALGFLVNYDPKCLLLYTVYKNFASEPESYFYMMQRNKWKLLNFGTGSWKKRLEARFFPLNLRLLSQNFSFGKASYV
jgi:hypothetical protein